MSKLYVEFSYTLEDNLADAVVACAHRDVDPDAEVVVVREEGGVVVVVPEWTKARSGFDLDPAEATAYLHLCALADEAEVPIPLFLRAWKVMAVNADLMEAHVTHLRTLPFAPEE